MLRWFSQRESKAQGAKAAGRNERKKRNGLAGKGILLRENFEGLKKKRNAVFWGEEVISAGAVRAREKAKCKKKKVPQRKSFLEESFAKRGENLAAGGRKVSALPNGALE